MPTSWERPVSPRPCATTPSARGRESCSRAPAEVYGARALNDYPARETLDLRPVNPYGASKAAAEAILLSEARSFGLDVVIARAFNHIGPGQDERFVVASFAAQLARIAAGGPPRLSSGI